MPRVACILVVAILATFAPMRPGRADQIGPSFDCKTARAPLAQILCSDPELSRLDLHFAQAYWALLAQVDDEAKRNLKQEDVRFIDAVQQQCGLLGSAAVPPPAPVTRDCVSRAYEKQRLIWLSRLTPPASEEANRPVEQHLALQRRLQTLGLLSATATIDGVYGVGTRAAIAQWQQLQRRSVTGILTEADAVALGQQASEPSAVVQTLAEPDRRLRVDSERAIVSGPSSGGVAAGDTAQAPPTLHAPKMDPAQALTAPPSSGGMPARADNATRPDGPTEVVEVARRLPCEQVSKKAWVSQFGRPIMWGIPGRMWGSRELTAIADRMDECRKTNPDEEYFFRDIILYYAQGQKEIEKGERQAEIVKELNRQNQATLAREQAIKQAEAEAQARQTAAKRAEEEADEREQALKRSAMDADRRRQQEAVAENVEAETRDRVAQAQRTTAEAEVREKAAKTRVLAAQQKEQEDHAERQKMQEARVAKASPEVRSFLARNPQLLSDKANASPGDICGGTCTPADLFTGIHLALAYQAEAALSACNEGQSFARELAEAHRRSALLEKTLVYIYGVSPADMARQHDAAWQKLTNPEVASAIKGVVLNAPQGCYNILRDTSLALTLDFQQ